MNNFCIELIKQANNHYNENTYVSDINFFKGEIHIERTVPGSANNDGFTQ